MTDCRDYGHFNNIGSFKYLIPLKDSYALNEFTESILLPILDKEEYLNTVITLVINNGDITSTALECNCHQNTIRYRWSKVRELIGAGKKQNLNFMLSLPQSESTCLKNEQPFKGCFFSLIDLILISLILSAAWPTLLASLFKSLENSLMMMMSRRASFVSVQVVDVLPVEPLDLIFIFLCLDQVIPEIFDAVLRPFAHGAGEGIDGGVDQLRHFNVFFSRRVVEED